MAGLIASEDKNMGDRKMAWRTTRPYLLVLDFLVFRLFWRLGGPRFSLQALNACYSRF